MSPSPNDYCLWLLRDTVCFRAGQRRAATDAPGLYRHASADADTILRIVDELLPTGRGKTIEMRLGFPWSRHVVVPWQDRFVDDASWVAWTQATCDAHGIAHASSRIALTPLRYGLPRLALTANDALLDAVGDCAGRHGMRLRHVTSTFAHALHHHRRAIPGPDAAVVLRERGTLTCALRAEGVVAAVTTQPDYAREEHRIVPLVNSLALSSAISMPTRVAVIGDALGPGHAATWLGLHLPHDSDEERKL